MPGPRRARADLVGGLVVSAIGIAWAWMAGAYGYLGEGGRVEAGTLPALAGAVLLVCGLSVTTAALIRHARARRPVPVDASEAELPNSGRDGEPDADDGAYDLMDAKAPLKRAVVLGGLLACLLLAPVLGFTAAFATLTFILVKLVEGRSLWAAGGAAAAIFAFGYVVFESLLQVPLP